MFQCLKHVQIQINELSSKKTRTNAEQATLQKLFNEQQNILRSGKIIPTVNGQNTQGLTFVSRANSFYFNGGIQIVVCEYEQGKGMLQFCFENIILSYNLRMLLL